MATNTDHQVSACTPQPGASPARRANGSAILFADFAAGNPLLQARPADDSTRKLTDGPTELMDRTIRAHQGQPIKTMEQSLLAEFDSPASAVHAAAEIERLIAESSGPEHSAAAPRIGIHVAGTGGILDGFGRAIAVAAGITRHAAPGQILISSEVHDAIAAEPDLRCQRFRALSLGDDPEAPDVFEIQWAELAPSIPPRYEVISRVGTGGMGIVYKVRDLEIQEIIAVKVLKSGIADDPQMQENLRREVSLARKVTHKNVCRIYEFNRFGAMACVSMEFIEGESLLSKLRREGPLGWKEALHIVRQICAGLREAHLQGIVHRDLKPANIMVDRKGVVKITDFGIARMFHGASQMTGTLVGTPAYMAPEQVELKRIDARTDVYALGLLFYEIVTASQAFQGDTPIAVALKQLRESPVRPRLIVPDLPARAEAIILKCLHKDPARRFQSMDELALALSKPLEAKPNVSAWRSIAADLRRFCSHLHRRAKACAANAQIAVQHQNWRDFTAKHARAFVGGFGVLCVLTGLLALAPRVHSEKSLSAIPPKSATMQLAARSGRAPSSLGDGNALPAFAPLPAASGTRSLAGYDVDLEYSEVSTQKLPSPEAVSVAPSTPVRKLASKAPTSAPARAGRRLRPSDAEAAAPPSAPSAGAQTNAPQPEAAAPVLSAKNDGADAPKPDPVVVTSDSAPRASDVESAKATLQEQTADENSPRTAHYFSVGSFKDGTWADQAVAKLVQLGFPAVSVHKKVLWVQSYEVRVGPYERSEDYESAGRQLRLLGFKPHAVK